MELTASKYVHILRFPRVVHSGLAVKHAWDSHHHGTNSASAETHQAFAFSPMGISEAIQFLCIVG